VLASLLTGPGAGRGQELRSGELGSSELEAAFLLNFLRFTAWPDDSFSAPEDPLVVTLIGADAIALDLSLLCVGERRGAEGRSVVVHYRNGIDPRGRGPGRPGRPATSSDLRRSHMIFVGRAEARQTGWILDQVTGYPVLTVSDDTGFVSEGGMLALVIRGGRMTFDADPEQIDRAGLTVSSKVLRLAHVVKPGVE
jgi:hypothetical protein